MHLDLHMSDHVTKDVPQETLFWPVAPWITTEKDNKQYILEHLDKSRSQYIVTSIICYDPYSDSRFTLENFAHTFCRQLIWLINSNPAEMSKDVLMPKYNQLQIDRYSDTIVLSKQITKQHQKLKYVWNLITDHPNMVNNTL